MVRRILAILATAVAVLVVAPSQVAATPDPDTPEPTAPEPEVPRPQPSVGGTSAGLIPVPPGCPVPAPADVAFVGTVVAKDEFVEKGTVRYRIDQVRAGDVGPFSVGGLIDVRYGPDSQYIDVDDQLLVSAAIDPNIATLASKISPEPLLFGGDAVIGVDDTETECPVIDDPIMTINVDGTPVESSLFTPFFRDGRLLLATVAVPAAVVGAALLGLVLLRRLLDVGFRGVFALGRAAVTPSPDHRATRVRRHVAAHEAEVLYPDDGLLDDESDVEGDETEQTEESVDGNRSDLSV